MAVNASITTGRFQQTVQTFKQGMFHFHLYTAISANDMVMFIPCNLVGDMPAGCVGWTHQAFVRKEFQGAIDRRFSETRQFNERLFIDFTGREMSPLVVKYMQDRQTLRGHSETAGAELEGIIG